MPEINSLMKTLYDGTQVECGKIVFIPDNEIVRITATNCTCPVCWRKITACLCVHHKRPLRGQAALLMETEMIDLLIHGQFKMIFTASNGLPKFFDPTTDLVEKLFGLEI